MKLANLRKLERLAGAGALVAINMTAAEPGRKNVTTE